ncbi:inovirus-type Gp2 protein [Paenalcaligenes hominis]|uniref:YagK/YfjJ domain-containing protein n=1 Tax=Paenalcaligenes hominis TaxID=643674 RepID=UPI003525B7B6
MVTKAKHNPKYQSIISNVIRRSLDAYTRVFVVRCDLRFPLETTEAEFDPKAISRFINSLKAKINADLR